MKNWWLNLNKREQNLVIAMSALVAFFLFITLVWQPLNDNLASKRKAIENKQELLVWVKENTAKFKGVKVKSGNRNVNLTSVVNSTARSRNIAIARMQPKGDSLQVWIDEVPFNDLLSWTENLYLNQGIEVTSADIVEADSPGIVRVNRLELSKS